MGSNAARDSGSWSASHWFIVSVMSRCCSSRPFSSRSLSLTSSGGETFPARRAVLSRRLDESYRGAGDRTCQAVVSSTPCGSVESRARDHTRLVGSVGFGVTRFQHSG